MLKKTVLIFLSLFLLYCLPARAYDAETPIRVGISDTNFSTYNFTSATFYSDTELQVTDTASGETVKVLK